MLRWPLPVIMDSMDSEADSIDVSRNYHLQDDLLLAGIRLALSTSGRDPDDERASMKRLKRSQEIYFKERDAMWRRIVLRRRGARDGG